MKKSNNRGVSLIEVLIAVIVFVICVIPIINQLIAGIRLGQKADDQQAATDYGKSITETVKQIDMEQIFDLNSGYVDKKSLAKFMGLANADDISVYSNIGVEANFYSISTECLKDNDKGEKVVDTDKLSTISQVIKTGSYVIPQSSSVPTFVVEDSAKSITKENYKMTYVSGGTGYTSVTNMYKELERSNAVASADQQQALVRSYKITYSHVLNARSYNVSLVLDNAPYAIRSLLNTSYTDPNKLNLGNLSSLDSSTTAVIVSASNYDSIAATSIMSSVLNALEVKGNAKAEQLKQKNQGVVDEFLSADLMPKKTTTITLSGSGPYTVKCDVTYTDQSFFVAGNGWDLPTRTLEFTYPAYKQDFDEIPDVYLMYNQYMYMSTFGSDTIVIENDISNTSGSKIIDNTARIFVVRTDEKDEDSKDLIQKSGELGADGVSWKYGYDRDKVDGGYLYRTMFEISNNTTAPAANPDAAHYPVEIYTNVMGTTPDKIEYITDVSGLYHLKEVNNDKSDNSTKISVTTPSEDGNAWTNVVRLISEDERYSDSGRMYDVNLVLENQVSGVITEYNSSKGDY